MAGSPACLYFYCYIAEQEFVAAKSWGLLRQTGSVLCNSSLGCLAFKTLPSTFYLHIRNVFTMPETPQSCFMKTATKGGSL